MHSCMISDNTYCYSLLHGGKEGGLEQIQLNIARAPDWSTAQLIDWTRLSPQRELYLRAILGMLIVLEVMQ